MDKFIEDVRYTMDMGCGLDVWRIVGTVNGKQVFVSAPVAADEAADVFVTKSGSRYKILSYACAKSEFFNQVREDIFHKGFPCA